MRRRRFTFMDKAQVYKDFGPMFRWQPKLPLSGVPRYGSEHNRMVPILAYQARRLDILSGWHRPLQ